MSAVLARACETKRVPVALARALGVQDDASALANRLPGGGDKRVDVPCWRHAIINFPHPLLQQGLVILDTPGLNAAGTEPELTRSLLPSAQVVLFVLAADTGVTKTELEVWRRDLAGDDPAQKAARIVVLNKIDSLWDGRKPEPLVAAEIDRQVSASATMLGLPRAQVLPVSAQKGLLAKVDGDDALLERSRLPALEDALASKLIPAKRDIVGKATRSGVRALALSVRERLEAREASITEQLADLCELRGKNQDVVAHMMARVTDEKELFERSVQRFAALRTVFTQQTSELFDVIGLEALRTNAGRTRRGIERSPFTKGVRSAMTGFFTSIRRDFDDAARRTAEIHDMMQAMYTQFASDQRTTPFTPPFFSMLKYQKEIDRLERAYNEHFNTLWNMLTQGEILADARILRDRRLARQARLRRREQRGRDLAALGDVTARIPRPRAPRSVAAPAGERQADPRRQRRARGAHRRARGPARCARRADRGLDAARRFDRPDRRVARDDADRSERVAVSRAAASPRPARRSRAPASQPSTPRISPAARRGSRRNRD